MTELAAQMDRSISLLKEHTAENTSGINDLQLQLQKHSAAPSIAPGQLEDVQRQCSEAHSLGASSQRDSSAALQQLGSLKEGLEQKLLDIAADSAIKLRDMQQACSKQADGNAQAAAAVQAALQKDAIRTMQRIEGLAAQHGAFAERLIAAEARAAGEVSPRNIRADPSPGKQEHGGLSYTSYGSLQLESPSESKHATGLRVNFQAFKAAAGLPCGSMTLLLQ